MTVSELQQALAQHPPDAVVYLEAADDGVIAARVVDGDILLVPGEGLEIVVIRRGGAVIA